MIAYEKMLQLKGRDLTHSWSDRDVMLYAIGIGMGQDPLDARELRYVYEGNLSVVPTFLTLSSSWGAGISVAQMQVNYLMVLHGSQKVEIHRPLAPSGKVTSSARVVEVIDKGSKGAIVISEVLLLDAADKEPVATLTSSMFARADGGFGGPKEGGETPHPVPDCAPDFELSLITRPEQGLLYRLSGDRNPLHADPQVSKAAGFDRPILHGLCTYGMTCRAVLAAWPDVGPEQILSHEARFSAPLFPGETLSVALWRDGKTISFEAQAKERNVAVIKNGKTVLRPVA
jgi:acyl dehydratase